MNDVNLSSRQPYFILRAKKDGITSACCGWWNNGGKVTLAWANVNSPLGTFPVIFRSSKEAWFFWFRWKEQHPEESEGWKPEVILYEP